MLGPVINGYGFITDGMLANILARLWIGRAALITSLGLLLIPVAATQMRRSNVSLVFALFDGTLYLSCSALEIWVGNVVDHNERSTNLGTDDWILFHCTTEMGRLNVYATVFPKVHLPTGPTLLQKLQTTVTCKTNPDDNRASWLIVKHITTHLHRINVENWFT